jgi:hypothetical protein
MQLFEFTGEEEHEAKPGKQGHRRNRVGRRCVRCGNPVPRCEDETYWRSGFCGWCEHAYEKLLHE